MCHQLQVERLKKCSLLRGEEMGTGNEVLRPVTFQRLLRLSRDEAFELLRAPFATQSRFFPLREKTIKQLSGICLPSSAEITSASRAMTRANQITFYENATTTEKKVSFPSSIFALFRTQIIVMSFESYSSASFWEITVVFLVQNFEI